VELPPPDSPELILFDLVVHVGTLVSVVIVMGDGLRELAAGSGRIVPPAAAPRTAAFRRRGDAAWCC
jgi:undecaprenyl-diphosphatase